MKVFKILCSVFFIALSTQIYAQSSELRQKKNSSEAQDLSSVKGNIQTSQFKSLSACPPNTFLGQSPTGSAYTSASQPGYRVFQKYENVSDTIYGLHFWALQLFHNGSAWSQCSSNPMNFNIVFYTDRFDLPHLLQDSMNISLVPYPTGELLSGVYPIYEFTVFFETPIYHPKGWFSLQSTNADCWSLIMATTDSDASGVACQYDGSAYTILDDPTAFCFLGNPGTCPYPIGLTVGNIQDVSADVSWVESGNAQSWQLEYGEHGFAIGSGTIISNVNTQNYTISGLNPYTEYDVYVKADCIDEMSEYSGPKTFKTIGCPLSEQCLFEFTMTDNFGDGWNGAAVEVYENEHLLTTLSLSGGVMQKSYVKICNGKQIKLKWVSDSPYDAECGLSIADPFNIPVFSFLPGSAPMNNTVFYTFNAECNPTCVRPMALKALNGTPGTIDLDWTENGTATQWQIEWGYFGFDFGWGMRTLVNSKPYHLTGLTAGTYYQYYVRAICGDNDTSDWVGPYLFNSDCPALEYYPYVEKFNGQVFPPLCWKNIDADGDGYTWIRDNNYFQAYEGTYYATSASWHSFEVGALTPDNYLITRKFHVSNPDVVLKFWVAALGDISFGINLGEEHYSVMVSTTNNEIQSFTPVYSETLQNNQWKEITLPLADYNGQDIFVAFRHHECTDEYYLRLDLISVVNTQGTDEIQVLPVFNFYPNPATDYLFISELSNVEIYSLTGNLIAKYSDVTKIDLHEFSAGYYVVKAFNDGKIAVRNIQVIK